MTDPNLTAQLASIPGVGSSVWLGVVTFYHIELWICCSVFCGLMVLLYDQIRMIRQWNREYRDRYGKQNKPNRQTPNAAMNALKISGQSGKQGAGFSHCLRYASCRFLLGVQRLLVDL